MLYVSRVPFLSRGKNMIKLKVLFVYMKRLLTVKSQALLASQTIVEQNKVKSDYFTTSYGLGLKLILDMSTFLGAVFLIIAPLIIKNATSRLIFS